MYITTFANDRLQDLCGIVQDQWSLRETEPARTKCLARSPSSTGIFLFVLRSFLSKCMVCSTQTCTICLALSRLESVATVVRQFGCTRALAILGDREPADDVCNVSWMSWTWIRGVTCGATSLGATHIRRSLLRLHCVAATFYSYVLKATGDDPLGTQLAAEVC